MTGMSKPRSTAAAAALAGVGACGLTSGSAFSLSPSVQIAGATRNSAAGLPSRDAPPSAPRGASTLGASLAGLGAAGLISGKVAAARKSRPRAGPASSVTPCAPAPQPSRTAQQAFGPENMDAAQQLSAWVHAVQGVHVDLTDIQEGFRQQFAGLQAALIPPAYADETAVVSAASDAVAQVAEAVSQYKAPEGVELDATKTYLVGKDGLVLVDPMGRKPLEDDWWNGFIGFQKGCIEDLDTKLRAAGVQEAFGWSIVLYTCFVKLIFYPLQQDSLKSTSMMQLMQPKVKEIQEAYKDDPETQSRMLQQLYQVMDVNPLGGCLPTFLQLPIFWSLYGVWRRFAAEDFVHYDEPFLWVPSLAKPNPDFQFKFDWLLEFNDGAPAMGWHDYICYLIFPVILVGQTLYSSQQATAAKPKPKAGEDDPSDNPVLKFLPLLSVYFIGSLSLELPQAVSLYYTTNSAVTLLQTALVKNGLRGEIDGYEEYEKTGKFPADAFERMAIANVPMPKDMGEAALRGDMKNLEKLFADKPEAINDHDEKVITPLGYACATGYMPAVQFLIKNGADITKGDGQDNSLLHYAAGYGHQEVLKEILEAGKEIWPNDEWQELKNKKGQTVMDAARVNKKIAVFNFLRERVGLEPVPEPEAEKPKPEVEDAEVISMGKREIPVAPEPAKSSEQSDAAAKARAALLAMAGQANVDAAEANPEAAKAADLLNSVVNAKGGPTAPGNASATANAMRDAVEKLKANPEAVEQAKKMMEKMPPGMLSMLTGNKMSSEQAQKAMDAMKNMDTSELLEKANTAAQTLEKVGTGTGTLEKAAAPAADGAKTARVVD